VWRFEPAFLDALEPAIGRNAVIEVVRNDGKIYVTAAGKMIEGDVTKVLLVTS
jgi:hypothetical protein